MKNIFWLLIFLFSITSYAGEVNDYIACYSITDSNAPQGFSPFTFRVFFPHVKDITKISSQGGVSVENANQELNYGYTNLDGAHVEAELARANHSITILSMKVTFASGQALSLKNSPGQNQYGDTVTSTLNSTIPALNIPTDATASCMFFDSTIHKGGVSGGN